MPTYLLVTLAKIQHGRINQEVFNKYEKLGEEIT